MSVGGPKRQFATSQPYVRSRGEAECKTAQPTHLTLAVKNSRRYNRTRNFGIYGHAESKKTQKFVFRSALRPNQISFSHDQDPKRTCPPEVISHYSRGVRSCSVVTELRAGRAEAPRANRSNVPSAGDEAKKARTSMPCCPAGSARILGLRTSSPPREEIEHGAIRRKQTQRIHRQNAG